MFLYIFVIGFYPCVDEGPVWRHCKQWHHLTSRYAAVFCWETLGPGIHVDATQFSTHLNSVADKRQALLGAEFPTALSDIENYSGQTDNHHSHSAPEPTKSSIGIFVWGGNSELQREKAACFQREKNPHLCKCLCWNENWSIQAKLCSGRKPDAIFAQFESIWKSVSCGEKAPLWVSFIQQKRKKCICSILWLFFSWILPILKVLQPGVRLVKVPFVFFYSQNQVVKSLNIKHTLPKISNPAYEYQPQQKPVLILLNLKQPSLSVFIYDCTLLDISGP